jgi:acyl dehydratase
MSDSLQVLKKKLFISQEAVIQFAEAVGDPNPIHQNKAAAVQMGLAGPIAHGMFVYSYLIDRFDEWNNLCETSTSVKWKIKSTRCRFHEPAFIGNEFESVVQLVDSKETSGKAHLTLFDTKGNKLTQIVAELTR